MMDRDLKESVWGERVGWEGVEFKGMCVYERLGFEKEQ